MRLVCFAYLLFRKAVGVRGSRDSLYIMHTLRGSMATIFRMRKGCSEGDYVRIRKELRDRVDGCFTDRCWTLKEGDDRGKIYLDKKMIDADTGQYVQIRRYLFLITWLTIPDRRKLIANCGNTRCVNPGHMTYKGFKPPYDIVTNLIACGWVTEQQMSRWYKK